MAKVFLFVRLNFLSSGKFIQIAAYSTDELHNNFFMTKP